MLPEGVVNWNMVPIPVPAGAVEEPPTGLGPAKAGKAEPKQRTEASNELRTFFMDLKLG
jgi:hypothetical protein